MKGVKKQYILRQPLLAKIAWVELDKTLFLFILVATGMHGFIQAVIRPGCHIA